MAIIKSVTTSIFDSENVKKGDCIRAKKADWNDYKNGFITDIQNNQITVLFYTSAGNAANYYTITAGEVAGELWSIYWTTDFINVYTEGVGDD